MLEVAHHRSPPSWSGEVISFDSSISSGNTFWMPIIQSVRRIRSIELKRVGGEVVFQQIKTSGKHDRRAIYGLRLGREPLISVGEFINASL
jgi:hypothetical protein